jgi:hypothetical protein
MVENRIAPNNNSPPAMIMFDLMGIHLDSEETGYWGGGNKYSEKPSKIFRSLEL